MKKALLLCASHNDLGLIRALRKLGYYIVVTGNMPDQPGEHWCDKYIQADYSDKSKILQLAKEERICAIVQCCNDFGVYTASYVAEQLGLPGYDSYETTCLLHNKDRFKAFAREHQLQTPLAESFSNSESALAWIRHADYPLIVKPVDASAGNGVARLDVPEGAEKAIMEAFVKSRSGRIVVEPFITGSQHGFCTFLMRRKVVAICSNDEYSFLNPYRVEIDTFPSSTFQQSQKVLIEQIEKIAEVLHLTDGIFHLQYIFDGEKPQILEVMRRILGNMYHVPGNRLNGFDWEYWETRARCGLPLTDFPLHQPQEGCFSYKTIMAPRNGVFKGISVPETYRKYIFDSFMLERPGARVTHYQSQPMGFLFMMFSSPEEMHQVLIDEYIGDLASVEDSCK